MHSCASLHKFDPISQDKQRTNNPNDARAGAVYRIVLTGGPCAGKSTSLEHVTKAMTAKGYDVLAVPEVPTIMMNGGCKYPGLSDPLKLLHFEVALTQLQLSIEDQFTRVAQSTGRPTIVVLDRGILDPKAYMGPDTWQAVLEYSGWSDEQLLERYDMVLHLVTAADGAEEFYTTANNAARTESPEQARALDKKMIGVWGEHARHTVVPNRGSFATKLEETVAAVEQLTVDVRPHETVAARDPLI